MKLIYVLLTSLSFLAFTSSCTSSVAERKPVPPQGSDESDMPWNRPQAGEGGGALGGMMNPHR